MQKVTFLNMEGDGGRSAGLLNVASSLGFWLIRPRSVILPKAAVVCRSGLTLSTGGVVSDLDRGDVNTTELVVMMVTASRLC